VKLPLIHPQVTTLATLDIGKRVSGLAFFRRTLTDIPPRDGGAYFSWTMYKVGQIECKPRRMVTNIIAAMDAEDINCRLALELPTTYARDFEKHRDIRSLLEHAKGLRDRIPSRIVHAALPSEWKRSVPKPIHWKRAAALMSEDEAHMFNRTGMDGKDAAVLGLTVTGRMAPGGA